MSVVHRVIFETESIHSIEFVKVLKMASKMFAAEGDNIAALTTLELMVQLCEHLAMSTRVTVVKQPTHPQLR